MNLPRVFSPFDVPDTEPSATSSSFGLLLVGLVLLAVAIAVVVIMIRRSRRS